MKSDPSPGIAERLALRLSLTMVVSSFLVAGLSAWSAGGLLPVAIAGTCCVAAAWSGPAPAGDDGASR
jgi:hypothetical protein